MDTMLVKTIIKFSKKQVFSLFKGSVVLFFILPLVACPLWGQVVQKKELSPADYHLWGETHIDKISNNEDWVSYTTAYQNGRDTLFVRNSINGKTFFYAGGANSIFTKNNYFICQAANSLHILNLNQIEKKFLPCQITLHQLKGPIRSQLHRNQLWKFFSFVRY